jgi:ferric-dicitrate binding protein FerR (iron transport regulator)
MSPRDSVDPERSRRLMMAALDGEISPEEQRELDHALETDSEVREEWERMSRVKEVTSTMVMREPPEEVWEEYWTSVYNRTERGIGWVLFSLGSIVLLGYGAWKWAEAVFQTEDLPFLPKAAILGVALGLSILVVSVIREKLFTKTRDPYKEVKR